MNKKTSKKNRENFIVAGYPSWSKDVFKEKISKYPGKWYLLTKPKQLTKARLKKINPKYIFFLHWSWKVPQNIINNYECVCFHMTDVPYGRGGTPLQNLIIRGWKVTKLTALRMTKNFDAGPVYLKKPLSLEGRAQEIYERASDLATKMILKIIKEKPTPKPQKGKVVIFKRRRLEESEIPKCENLQKLYDFIRMLDADGYPNAFIKYKGFVLEFFSVKLLKDYLLAKVKIKKDGKRK